MNRVELEVTLSNGNTRLIAVKGVKERVFQGGQMKSIVAPMLNGFDFNKPYLIDSPNLSLHIEDLFEVASRMADLLGNKDPKAFAQNKGWINASLKASLAKARQEHARYRALKA
jgi:hypothetical protein